MITMDEPTRAGVFDAARAMLRAEGVEGVATVDVAYGSDVWRARRRR